MDKTYPQEFKQFLELWGEMDDINCANAILSWDQSVIMPAKGAKARGYQMTTLSRLSHERLTSPNFGKLLENLSDWAAGLDYHSDEASMIRVARRQYDKMKKLPTELVTKISQVGNESYFAWLEAREANDFKVFAPKLEEYINVLREAAEITGYEDHIMDVMVDRSESGMKAAEVETLFAELRETLVPLIKKIKCSGINLENALVTQKHDADRQLKLTRLATEAINFDYSRGRFDLSVHPFTTSFSSNDVRITSRIKNNAFSGCFFGGMHEAGHGHYCQGVPEKFERTPLHGGASSGIHESQSRTWENLVGRSRGFTQFFFPQFQQMFPEETKGFTAEDWYQAVNRVQPSYIRVEADEVTYNLHIMIRFELEKAVYDGKIKVCDLREAYNEKFKAYLGITPPDDVRGVIQDIHWTQSFGSGYQGYTIGNVASVQFYETALKAHPEFKEAFARGDYAGLLKWSNDHIHNHGRKYQPQELLEIVTGRKLDAKPYLKYITDKYTDLYQLK